MASDPGVFDSRIIELPTGLSGSAESPGAPRDVQTAPLADMDGPLADATVKGVDSYLEGLDGSLEDVDGCLVKPYGSLTDGFLEALNGSPTIPCSEKQELLVPSLQSLSLLAFRHLARPLSLFPLLISTLSRFLTLYTFVIACFTLIPPSLASPQPLSPSITTPPQPSVTSNLALVSASPDLMVNRQAIWRQSISKGDCGSYLLTTGTIYFGTTSLVIAPGATATLSPVCIYGRPASYVDNESPNNFYDTFPVESSFNATATISSFNQSPIPLIYAISASTFTCLLLTCAVFGSQVKRPFLHKLSLILSSVYLLYSLIFSIVILEDQFSSGYMDADELRYRLAGSLGLNILYLIFNTFLLFALVQTIMVLFPRQSEKRIILWIGGTLSILCQTLWAIAVFYGRFSDSPLPAFVYLFQITFNVLFMCCVAYYTFYSFQSAFHPSNLIITCLTLLATISPLALFVFDVANLWVVEWSDSLNWLTSTLLIVTTWEWADRVEKLARHREKHGVLGRQLYEDESDSHHFQQVEKRRDSGDNGGGGNDRHSRDRNDGNDQNDTARFDTSQTLDQLPPNNAGESPTRIPMLSESVDPEAQLLKFHLVARRIVSPILLISDAFIRWGRAVSRSSTPMSNPRIIVDIGDDWNSDTLKPLNSSVSDGSHTGKHAFQRFFYPAALARAVPTKNNSARSSVEINPESSFPDIEQNGMQMSTLSPQSDAEMPTQSSEATLHGHQPQSLTSQSVPLQSTPVNQIIASSELDT